MQPVGRIHNFGAGPAVLPYEVVQEVSEALPNLSGSGFGLMEVSHRSDTFQAVIDSAIGRVRSLLSVPDDYEVLLLQGGASTQFYMTALNLIGEGGKADYLVSGTWSKKALKEATPHIVVGTPGRLKALIGSKDLNLSKLKHFVMDECDRLLEALDMRRDIQEIFRTTPHQKQVMMFSAMLAKEIRPVCKKFCQDPMEIYVDDDTKLTLHGLQQYYVKLQEAEKNRKLNDLLDDFDIVIPLVDEKTDIQQSMSNPHKVLKNKVDSCQQMIEQLIS